MFSYPHVALEKMQSIIKRSFKVLVSGELPLANVITRCLGFELNSNLLWNGVYESPIRLWDY